MPPQHQADNTSINHSSAVIKRKRTKRPRSNSPSSDPPPLLNMPDDYNCSSGDEDNVNQDQEEEDMANCLIMLAQGNGAIPPNNATAGGNSRKFSNKDGFFVYDCKTCNRSFPSFQALGGHRASHKKPKTNLRSDGEETEYKIASAPTPTPTTLALQITTLNNNKGKVHECSICGSEFSSGQALGGHMRRHRAAMMANQPTDVVDIKHRNVLSLDLNLPAPEDDHHLHTSPKFQFGGSPPSTALVFSTPALVDCYY